MPNNNITPPRVPLVDTRTGLVAREWYLFFFNLFELTGGGTSSATITDLQVGPTSLNPGQVLDLLPQFDTGPDNHTVMAQLAAVTKVIQSLQVGPAALNPAVLTTALQALQVAPQVGALAATVAEVQKGLQAIQVAPAAHPLPSGLLNVVSVAAASYTVQATDNVVLVNFAGAVAVTMPLATRGRMFVVKDSSGAAGVNNVTMTPLSGLVDGSATSVITANYASYSYVADGTDWWII